MSSAISLYPARFMHIPGYTFLFRLSIMNFCMILSIDLCLQTDNVSTSEVKVSMANYDFSSESSINRVVRLHHCVNEPGPLLINMILIT